MSDGDAAQGGELVVFWIRSSTSCADCGADLPKGSLLRKQGEKGLCMSCADLDHLAFLGRGDAALTRRSRKYSRLSAVVVEWSRTRKRYERQGLLVEEEALARAQEECLADADLREARRLRSEARRTELDADYVDEFARHIREHYPRCPEEEATHIAEHACRKHSRRVGRTAAAKEFDPETIRLAVVASIRHRHTRYGDLLTRGWDRYDARQAVEADVWRVEEKWAGT